MNRHRRAILYDKWKTLAVNMLSDGKTIEEVVDTLVPMVLKELGSEAAPEATVRSALRYLCEGRDEVPN